MRGRPLKGPKGRALRPTSDRLRERIFNILTHGNSINLAGAEVADIFAGTGALGIEALSRGAASAVFVDSDGAARKLVRDNLAAMKLVDKAEVMACPANQVPLRKQAFDLVFLDPPYHANLLMPVLERLLAAGWIDDGTYIVIETGHPGPPTLPLPMKILDRRTQGQSEIIFARVDG